VWNEDGTVKVKFAYSAWGEFTRAGGVAADEWLASFTGKEYDATGLLHFNARYYDPTLGRFLTEDPSRKGTSWYAYCNNNPLTYTDATGRYESLASAELTGNIPAAEQRGAQRNWRDYAGGSEERLRERRQLSILEISRKNIEFASILRSLPGTPYSPERPPSLQGMDCSGCIAYAVAQMGYSVDPSLRVSKMASGDVPWIATLPDVRESRQGKAGVLNFYQFEGQPQIAHVNVGVGIRGTESIPQVIDATKGNWMQQRIGAAGQSVAPQPDSINQTYVPFSTNTSPILQAVIDWSKLWPK
jgi:RHS repeat-associated protein